MQQRETKEGRSNACCMKRMNDYDMLLRTDHFSLGEAFRLVGSYGGVCRTTGMRIRKTIFCTSHVSVVCYI